MECYECKKQLKGGFGVGPKPYTHFRCADCVIEKVSRDSMVNGFNMIKEECDKIVFTDKARGYKARYEALIEKLKVIRATDSRSLAPSSLMMEDLRRLVSGHFYTGKLADETLRKMPLAVKRRRQAYEKAKRAL